MRHNSSIEKFKRGRTVKALDFDPNHRPIHNYAQIIRPERGVAFRETGKPQPNRYHVRFADRGRLVVHASEPIAT